MPTAATTSVESDDQRNPSLSTLRLSEVALEPVSSGHNVTTGSTESVNEQSAASDVTAESKLSRLSRESDLAATTDTQPRKVERAEPQLPAAEVVLSEMGSETSETDMTTLRPRSRAAGIVYQSSLPDLVDSREDKDSATAVVSICLFSIFNVVIVVLLAGREVTGHVCVVLICML